MQIHHVIRGGLLYTGVGIGTALIAASAEAGSLGVFTAPAAEHVAAAAPAPEVELSALPLPEAPAAIPVVIHVVEPEVPVAAPPAVVEEAVEASEPAPEPPVVQAGPGPVTPVPGTTTLIDPIVIERAPDEAAA